MRFLKINKQLLLILLIHFVWLDLIAQKSEENRIAPMGGGKFNVETNHSCVNNSHRESIVKLIQDNVIQFGLNKEHNSKLLSGDFIWPLKESSALDFYDYHAISNFLDHDETQGLLDYNCQERSYDNHKGTDFIMWPFPWYIYDNEFVEVVAVNDGVIVGKEDGNFDSNCSLINNSSTWNAIYLMHNDGYTTWYGHLKENSLTSKSIGDTINQGEYLGLVASSGFTDTPHLHFEVYNEAGELVDPYTGDCNTAESLWQDQKEYREPTVNAVLTHSKIPEMGCPTANEKPHFSNDFMIGDTVFVAAYFHDQIANEVYNYSLIDPNGNVWQTWEYSSDETFNISWWYWCWFLPANSPGTWRFRVEKDGQINEHLFNYGMSTGIHENELSNIIIIYPNPTNSKLNIIGESDNIEILRIFSTSGQELVNTRNWKNEIDISEFPKGIYFVKIVNNESLEVTKRIIKY